MFWTLVVTIFLTDMISPHLLSGCVVWTVLPHVRVGVKRLILVKANQTHLHLFLVAAGLTAYARLCNACPYCRGGYDYQAIALRRYHLALRHCIVPPRCDDKKLIPVI